MDFSKKPNMLLIILAITAMSSLIYEIVWSRELSQVFGTGAFAITTVITVFLGGLALGSLLCGKILDKIKDHYKFLAYLEIAIGLTCIITLFLFKPVASFYMVLFNIFGGNPLVFNFILFLLSLLILIVPTFLIGIVFPTITKLYNAEKEKISSTVGNSYFADTIGGGAGVIIAGFFLIALLGLFKTSLLASSLNMLSGFAVLYFYKSSIETMQDKPSLGLEHNKFLLALFFFSGFAALVFEVIWIRYISLIYGSSLYSFSIVLASFLIGLALGSMYIKKIIEKSKDKVRLFAYVELLIGVLGIILIGIFPLIEFVFLWISTVISYFPLFFPLLFLVCFLILLAPTMLMGATLPIISSIYVNDLKVAHDVGRLYGINSLGSIFGSFLAGFVIIPKLGLAYSSLFAAAVYFLIAFGLIFFIDEAQFNIKLKKAIPFAAIIVVTLLFSFSIYNFNPLFGGVYYHGNYYQEGKFDILYLKNSAYGEVRVLKEISSGSVMLQNNAKTDASTLDYLPQMISAHAPMLLHSNPKEVYNLGIGGGWTLNSILAYDIENVDAVEIDPKVVEADKTVLKDYNGDSLNNPKSNIIIADGRNYLFSTDKKYDVIISEPPNIWVSGVSNLFTKEFYEIVEFHLKEGGRFSQWLPKWEMSEEDYKIILNTILSIFEYVYEFDIGNEVILVISNDPIDPADTEKKLKSGYFNANDEAIKEDLNRLGIQINESENPQMKMADALIRYYKRDHNELREYVKDTNKINTDDKPILEFNTLYNLYKLKN